MLCFGTTKRSHTTKPMSSVPPSLISSGNIILPERQVPSQVANAGSVEKGRSCNMYKVTASTRGGRK